MMFKREGGGREPDKKWRQNMVSKTRMCNGGILHNNLCKRVVKGCWGEAVELRRSCNPHDIPATVLPSSAVLLVLNS